MKQDAELIIGLMSGTSLDGIDAVLAQFPAKTPEKTAKNSENLAKMPESPVLLAFLTHPLEKSLTQRLQSLNLNPQISLHELASLQLELGLAFSGAAQALMMQTHTSPADITVLGSHGQTIFHAPHLHGNLGMSLQLGHPAIIAKRSGLAVAADFRVDDMALGGQGAPLAPAFHRVLFAPQITEYKAIAVVNIGGISNLSLLTKNHTLGYDLGPGNGLMDEVCQRYFACDYDKNGHLAAAGKVDERLLNQLKQHPFFQQSPPKSTGKETFNFQWLRSFELPENPKDLLATLNQLTADLIIEAVQHTPAKQLILCGGGALNSMLVRRLQQGLQNLNMPVQSSQAYGIDPMAIEALLIAWLAYRRHHQIPTDLTQITGSGKPTLLGSLTLP